MMDFFEFAKQVAELERFLRAEDRNIVNVKVGSKFVHDIKLQDDGSGHDNLDVVIVDHRRQQRRVEVSKRYYVVELELDDTKEELHPDHDEVKLQIERALTEAHEEFGIVDATAVSTDSDYFSRFTFPALEERRKTR